MAYPRETARDTVGPQGFDEGNSVRQTALQRWAAQHPKRALALWVSTGGNLLAGTILFSFAGEAISCPVDGGSAVGCDYPSRAGDPVLSVLAWVGFTMLLVGAATIIGGVVWYIVRLKREGDANKRRIKGS
ncbi:hypothetical protein ACFY5F_26330 [Streptomyces sp. NPDC013161]|uniref:hypothetical protein n=1 Tax=Streptomyces sp. NPDC013161 TaxID=3364862 RepID=UPI0036BAB905